MSGAKRGGRRPEPRADESEKDIFKRLLLQEVGGNVETVRMIDDIFMRCDDMDDTIVELIGTIEPDLLDQKMEEAKRIYSENQRRMAMKAEEEAKQQRAQAMAYQPTHAPTYNTPRPQQQPHSMGRGPEPMSGGRDPRELPDAGQFGALSKNPSRISVKEEPSMRIKEEPSARMHQQEPQRIQPQEIPIEQQIDINKLQQTVQLNHDKLKKKLKAKFDTMKKTKGFTPAFLDNLHWAFMIYMGNILRELVKISAIEYDADFKLFSKERDEDEDPHMFDKRNEKVVLTDLGDPETDAQILETHFYLVKTSHLQEDQKIIDDIDAKEKDRIAMETQSAVPQSLEGAEEKITKKVKKEENDYTELVKHLFKSRTEKEKDPESGDKKIEEANRQLSLAMFSSKARQTSAPGKSNVVEPPLARDNSTKGKKAQPTRRKISLKHLIYFLENNHQYKRSKYLQEAYFDTS